MPEICRFLGIVIRMFYYDHAPPHFHAAYGDNEVLVSIIDLQIVRGSLPPKVMKRLMVWAEKHKDELMENWERASQGMDALPISSE